jgi:hypothetical protein
MAKHSKLMAEKIVFGHKTRTQNVQNLQIQIKECDLKIEELLHRSKSM